ncbi:MAG: hypothetical protein NTZ36_01885 [Candidatus Jorgensenbacteria bacterium]|nr:hypothetical protein [Candidatus Jorgensenbacteria bacterium]
MLTIVAIIALSIFGIVETAYLIHKRVRAERPVCILGDDCTLVLESKYNKIFMIPNDMLGLFGYVAIFLLSLLYSLKIEPTHFWALGISFGVAIGCAASFIFAYIQWKLIKAWCFWCLMSAFTLWLMGIILLVSGF